MTDTTKEQCRLLGDIDGMLYTAQLGLEELLGNKDASRQAPALHVAFEHGLASSSIEKSAVLQVREACAERPRMEHLQKTMVQSLQEECSKLEVLTGHFFFQTHLCIPCRQPTGERRIPSTAD